MMHLPIQHALLNSLAAAIGCGIFLMVMARRTGVPAIILLFAGGVFLGPEMLGVVHPESLQGLLPVIVSLAVGMILFEGGLTLDLRGYERGSKVISRLLSVGVLITWLGTALCVWLVFKVSIPVALLAGSLVIVTGPTVIGPLLKRIKIDHRLHTILYWEAVLIDAIGVFIAILCFEWLAGGAGAALWSFGLRVISGMLAGLLGGFGLIFALRRRLIPHGLVNGFVVGWAVFIFALAEAAATEAGLLAVTLAGFIVGWKQPVELRQIRLFKAELTDLLIGMLFILLAARLQVEQLIHFGWQGVLLVLLNIFISTLGTGLGFREKLFLSWVAPRGIVAASMASLFALALAPKWGAQDAGFLEVFTYSVIIATVVLQGFSAGPLAHWLGLQRPEPNGWLIVSGDAFSRQLAGILKREAGLDVLILDTNPRLIGEARHEGLPALCENALETDGVDERLEFQRIGQVLALTDNGELNELLCERWAEWLGPEHTFRWQTSRVAVAPGRHGRIVFPRMPRPSIIATEIMSGEAYFEVRERRLNGDAAEGGALLILRPGIAIPVTEDAHEPLKEGDKEVILRRTSGCLARSLEVGGVLELSADNLRSAHLQLSAYFLSRHPKTSRDQIQHELVDPEKLVPAWLGHGVSIPHFYSTEISRTTCVLGILRPELRVPETSEPLRLIFFLVSPASDPEGHLAALGEIAGLCSDEGMRGRLYQAHTLEEALDVISS